MLGVGKACAHSVFSDINRERMEGACLPPLLLALLWEGAGAHHWPCPPRAACCPSPAPEAALPPRLLRCPECFPLHAAAPPFSVPLRSAAVACPPRCSVESPFVGGREATGDVYSIRAAGIRTSALRVCPHFLGLKPEQTVNKKPIRNRRCWHEERCRGENTLCS